jgi:hypothetical protein
MNDKKRLEMIKESYSNCIDIALSDGETLPSYDIEVADLNFLIQQAEKVKRYEYALKNIAYSNFKGDSFEKMAREFAKEALEK